jgi:hypothetical protein
MMLIQIKTIKENKDGSANVRIYYDQKGLKLLLQHGLTSILEQTIVKGEKDGVQSVLGAVPKKSGKANSAKIVGKNAKRSQAKSTRGNTRASKILGR